MQILRRVHIARTASEAHSPDVPRGQVFEQITKASIAPKLVAQFEQSVRQDQRDRRVAIAVTGNHAATPPAPGAKQSVEIPRIDVGEIHRYDEHRAGPSTGAQTPIDGAGDAA